MPKIYEYFGFIFFFFSNEHEPIHVHVTKSGCQTVLSSYSWMVNLLKYAHEQKQDTIL